VGGLLRRMHVCMEEEEEEEEAPLQYFANLSARRGHLPAVSSPTGLVNRKFLW